MSQTLVGSGLLFGGGLVKHWPFLCILVHLEKERMEAISLCVGLPTGLFFHQIIMKEKWSDPHSSLPPSPHFPFFPFSLPLPPSLPPSHHPHTMSCVPIVGASLSEPHTSVVYGTMCIDRPTDRPTPPSRLTCHLQHSSGLPPVMIIICLVYHNRYPHLCSLSPLTFPPSLPSSLTSPPHNVLCTHSWNAHLCCHCSLLPSVLEDRGQDRLV